MLITFDESQQFFHLKNDQLSYVIGIEKGKYLTHRYFGPPLTSYHGSNQLQLIGRGFATNPIAEERHFSLNTLPLETSTNGSLDYRVSNYRFRNLAGEGVTAFEFSDYQIITGKPQLAGLPSLRGPAAETLQITLVDTIQQLSQVMTYTIYPDRPVITRSITYHNDSEQIVYLEQAGSMLLDFPSKDFDFVTLDGSHTDEANINRSHLRSGIQAISSLRGTSSPQHQPFIALAEPQATEDQGKIYAFHLIYSGNFLAQAEVEQYGSTRVQMGIHPEEFSWKLSPKAAFQTPEVVLNFSDSGFNKMSQTFHKLYQEHLIPEFWQNKARPILLNTWEGNYFSFTEKKLLSQATQAKDLGIELFVLDDGWFGKRDDDTTSLGDWQPDTTKLPEGITGLAKKIHEKDLLFGLWFEPEMVSKNSNLFRQHPEWVLQVTNYPMTEGRGQLVLDLSQKNVQDFLIDMLDGYLKDGHVDYIKWDMNRHLTEVGNQLMPTDSQKEISHRYVLGLYRILETITGRYPNVLFENCSSGGGRFDPGMMAFMPQTWTSDNSDALCRTRIQSGYSYLYPPVMMGAHVSDVPNHQVGRITPLETRGLVAMSGNFGYELSLQKQTPEDLEIIRQQITFYKAHRQLLQFGEFYRLQLPDHLFATAWLFKNKIEALLVYSNGLAQSAQQIHQLQLKYLDDDADYLEATSQERYSGSELNHAGILIPPMNSDFQSFYRHYQKL